MEAAEKAAREANLPEKWDAIWEHEGKETWREQALADVYKRICELTPRDIQQVHDVGGGIGILAQKIAQRTQAMVNVYDSSSHALLQAERCHTRVWAACVDFETNWSITLPNAQSNLLVSTECLEHLSTEARHRVLHLAKKCGKALISVPNDRLGPDEEPQHTVKFNAMSFKRFLREYFKDVRVEVIGDYLLGVCGFPKSFTLSMCLPCRDEAEDLAITLASFRGVADEIVVGIDPRTTDNTREVAAKYADVVFELDTPEGPPGEEVRTGGVHFAHVRNQCMERCTGDWIFMTEGHERLHEGHDVLLKLDELMPQAARVGFVLRTSNGQQWGFPWLSRNAPDIRYKRSTHNVLDFPDGTYVVQLPQVKTLHERAQDREIARAKQRKVQNRIALMDDWLTNGNENSLYYLGTEWREYDEARAIKYLREFIALRRNNGPMRYQTRLVLAKMLAVQGEGAEAREVLLGAAADDWTRTDHWIWLGDLAYNQEKFEEALQWYLYGATRIEKPPFTIWWIDLTFYSWIPAQRLAMCYGALGRLEDSLHWAKRVLELLPTDAPVELSEEVTANIGIIEETINERNRG